MDPIGKIRIKNFGKLLPPNSLYITNEKVDTYTESSMNHQILNGNIDKIEETRYQNTENLSESSFNHTSLKLERIKAGSSLFDFVDLTEDSFETLIKENTPTKIPLEKIKILKLTKSKTKNSKTQIKPKSSVVTSLAAKAKNEDASQTNLLSFFTPSSTVKRVPQKLRKQPETNQYTNLCVGGTPPPRKLSKLSLRRNILNTIDDMYLVNKSKNEVEKQTHKSKTKIRPKKLNNSKRDKSKHLKELENVPEPTVIPGVIDLCLDCGNDEDIKLTVKSPNNLSKRTVTVKSEKSICPSYKVVEGTKFAVDGFKFGRIVGVTAYFLSHYHSDHYIGLTRKFSMPLYVSQITANLIREFIPIDEKYINILPLNITTTIEDVHVTAIDANHCPGAVMFLFQLPCGKRILHTGDFRASIEMESDHHLNQRNIDLLYLDTTYISNKYSFQTQEESIADALKIIREFKERNEGKRILFVVGTYLVGKEKFWLPIVKEFDFKIWTDNNRRKIMHAINDEEILQRLVTKSGDADLHIISMMKVGYRGIETYWEDHCDSYDMIFAIRPSGWEKNSKPQFRGQLNIVGIEYSEHSSHNELRRFLSFLKPKRVISTVPYGKDLTKCPDVPLSWYKKECFSPIKKQASLLDYFKSSKNENKIS